MLVMAKNNPEDIKTAIEAIEQYLAKIKDSLDKPIVFPENPEIDDFQDFIKTEEVAKILRCTVQTVYDKVRRGEIKRYKIGKRNLYRKSEIMDYINR